MRLEREGMREEDVRRKNRESGKMIESEKDRERQIVGLKEGERGREASEEREERQERKEMGGYIHRCRKL